MNLNKSFLKHCQNHQFEINPNQVKIVKRLSNYYIENFKQNFFKKIFSKKFKKLGYYLVGDVGVGKTMILNFFINELQEKKNETSF